jgi:hypothetical protein
MLQELRALKANDFLQDELLEGEEGLQNLATMHNVFNEYCKAQMQLARDTQTNLHKRLAVQLQTMKHIIIWADGIFGDLPLPSGVCQSLDMIIQYSSDVSAGLVGCNCLRHAIFFCKFGLFL